MPKLTKEQVPLLIEDYKAGMLYKDLMKKYNVTDSSITYHVTKLNLPKRQIRYSDGEVPEDKIVEMYKNKVHAAQIAKECRIGIVRLYDILDKYNLSMRKKSYSSDYWENVSNIINDTYKQCANKLHIGNLIKTPSGKAKIVDIQGRHYIVKHKAGYRESFTLWEVWDMNFRKKAA